ncbi:MAG: sensor histidine kinase [Gemmatimonadales bacterium]
MSGTSLRSLRLKLTLWYLSTLCGILLLLGGGLFIAIGHRFARELDESLRDATGQLERAARIRELESGARGRVVDAVEELRVPDRMLFLLDTAGTPVTPAEADPWIRAAATHAATAIRFDTEHHTHRDRTLRLHAERFTLSSGRVLVAAAVADKVELEDRYAALIAEFGGAALIAMVLVAAGGWLLVRQATAPIERNVAQMRRFMADAAHELRTPITVLRTQAEVALQRTRDVGGYVGALRSIESESRRLGRIVDDLLILARADSGERPIHLDRLFLDDVVMDVVGAAGAMATARGVALTLDGFDEAPVNGDAELLRQLVMILVDNALKFTLPGGRVDVAVGVREGAAVATVADTGPGIAAEHLPHIFERFYRSDPARSRGDPNVAAAGGAGLGLSIARWIANAHQAEIAVVSEPGQGTIFTVRFPVLVSGGSVSLP